MNDNEVWRIIGVFRMAPLVDRTLYTLLMLMWQVVFSHCPYKGSGLDGS